MKKIALFSIVYIIAFNILLPLAYYKLKGYAFIYGSYFDTSYIDKAAVILIILFIVSLLVILFSKGERRRKGTETEEKIDEISGAVNILFAAATVFKILQLFYSKMPVQSSLIVLAMRYVELLLDYRLIYFIKLYAAYQNRKFKSVLISTVIYIAISFLALSRSGIIWAVFMNITLLIGLGAWKSFSKKNVKRLVCIFGILVVISPIVYKQATIERYELENDVYGNEYFVQQIISRLSFLEIAGKELKGMEYHCSNTEVFQKKYSVTNQIQLMVNQLIIGNLFEDDVAPNQYWRCIFMGASEDYCENNYCSINFVLPVYYIYKYGFLAGVLLYLLTLWGYFRFACTRKEHVMRLFLGGYYLNILLNFFDWVYIFADVLCFFLTYLVFKFFCQEYRKAKSTNFSGYCWL